jgi:putative hydrolase of the HAD superfamily
MPRSDFRELKAIVFDAVGTLIHLPRGVGFHYARGAARQGWNAGAPVLEAAFRKAWKAMPPAPLTRAPRADDDRGWWKALVDRVLDAAGAPSGFDRSAYFAELYDEFAQPGVWELFAETRVVLDELRSRARLAVLSNFDGRLRAVLGHLGISDYFEHLFISSEIGADKPDPWIFQHALDRLALAPSELLLVGDEPEADIAGAQRAGWHAFHVDRPRVTLHDLAALMPASKIAAPKSRNRPR